MKAGRFIFIGLTIILASAVISQAQTNFQTVLVTNWVKPGPYLRVVGGKLYNTAYSTLWTNLTCAAGFNPHFNLTYRWVIYVARLERIDADKIVCGIYQQEYWPETHSGINQLEGEEFLEHAIVYNYSDAKSFVTGQELPNKLRCMRISNYITNGISYAAFDCGVQSTNPVPVVTKKVKSENSNSTSFSR